MIDGTFDCRNSYYEHLKGKVMFKGNAVPVYDKVPDKASYPYIALMSQTFLPLGWGKACREYTHTILINVYTGYSGLAGGKTNNDLIAKQVIELLLPEVSVIPTISTEIEILNTEIEMNIQGEDKIETDMVYRRSLRFRNLVQQI